MRYDTKLYIAHTWYIWAATMIEQTPHGNSSEGKLNTHSIQNTNTCITNCSKVIIALTCRTRKLHQVYTTSVRHHVHGT